MCKSNAARRDGTPLPLPGPVGQMTYRAQPESLRKSWLGYRFGGRKALFEVGDSGYPAARPVRVRRPVKHQSIRTDHTPLRLDLRLPCFPWQVARVRAGHGPGRGLPHAPRRE
jgi:hypothetical protein